MLADACNILCVALANQRYLVDVAPGIGLTVGIEAHLYLTTTDLQVFDDNLMPFAIAIRHIDACGVIAHLGVHIELVESAATLDVATQSIKAVLQFDYGCRLHCLTHLACKVHLILNIQTIVTRHHLAVSRRVASVEHRRVGTVDDYLVAFDDRGLPPFQVRLLGLVAACESELK